MPSFNLARVQEAALDRDLHQLADAVAIDADEGIVIEQALLQVIAEEAAGIVARQAEAGLRQIVGAEAEELGRLGDLAGAERSARQLDHRAGEIVELHAFGLHHLIGDAVDHRLDEIELFFVAISGIMISGTSLAPVSLTTFAAASKIARACIS